MNKIFYIFPLIALMLTLLMTTTADGAVPEVKQPVDAEYETVAIEEPVVEVVTLEAEIEVLPEVIEVQKKAPELRYELLEAERDLVERVVAAEAVGECFQGQMAVAQCIRNGCEQLGLRPAALIEEYQYSPNRPEPTQSVKDAVAAVFDRGEMAVDDTIFWFYAPAGVDGTPWHESQRFVIEIGGHRFFGMW